MLWDKKPTVRPVYLKKRKRTIASTLSAKSRFRGFS